jgi:hypothetical protein
LGDLLNLVIEVPARKEDKAAKVATARTLWVPAVNHTAGSAAGFHRDRRSVDAENLIRGLLHRRGLNEQRRSPVAKRNDHSNKVPLSATRIRE